MVHGVCSSAGCFSMTDNQIAEIYAVAREAFNGGQREIQMQSYPFHMTAENLAKHRLDPNIDFWRQLKNGSDHFEVTKLEPTVGVCGKRYVFDAKPDKGGAMEASAPCPTLQRDDVVEAAVSEKQAHDDAQVAELVKQGVKPIELVYEDGGQNEHFRYAATTDVSRPEAIAYGPTEIPLDEHGKPIPAVVKVAAADAARAAPVKPAATEAAPAAKAPPATASTPAPQPQAQTNEAAASSGSPFSAVMGVADSSGSMVKKWFSFGSSERASNDVKVYEPTQPMPADVPLPPKRNAAVNAAQKPQAALPAAHVVSAGTSPSPLIAVAAAMQASKGSQ
jgi:hypothetical protein